MAAGDSMSSEPGSEATESIMQFLSIALILFGILQLLGQFKESAPAEYGRYSPSSGGVNGRLAWFLQEMPAFLVPAYLFWFTQITPDITSRILLCFFVLHYFNRTFVYSFLIRGGRPVPWGIMMSACIFCAINGYLQGGSLLYVSRYPRDWVTQPCFIWGTMLYCLGFFINVHSDSILRNLRKPGESSYKIPHGGMFEYVSGANYLGEITEWIGYGFACWSLHAASFAIFSAIFLACRSFHHHRWYKEKFVDSYPVDRKAIIPFIL